MNQAIGAGNVRYWHKADIGDVCSDVRFRG